MCVILVALNTNGTNPNPTAASRYSERELIRRLLVLAWRFRTDCIWSVVLSFVLLLLGIGGLKLLGLVIDVIRGALDPALPAAVYPLGGSHRRWSALRTVAAIAVVIIPGAAARGAHLHLQHDHGPAHAGRDRASVAGAALREISNT